MCQWLKNTKLNIVSDRTKEILCAASLYQKKKQRTIIIQKLGMKTVTFTKAALNLEQITHSNSNTANYI